METCGASGCTAMRLAQAHCLGHATTEEIATAVKRWHLGAALDVRGARLDEGRLRLLSDELERQDEELLASPLGDTRRAAFCGEARFQDATFVGVADFSRVAFKGPVYFDGAVFCGHADFRRAEFLDHADFDNVDFRGSASFRGAIFSDHAGFQNAKVGEDVGFPAVKFRSYVDFEGAVVGGDLNLTETTFQLARRLGPFRVGGKLTLDHCEFAERVNIEVRAKDLTATGAIFAAGVQLSVAEARLGMNGTEFGRGATLSGVLNDDSPAARLLTISGAQVATLAISGVDLSHCRFFGAHGLESMIIKPSCSMARTPKRLRCIDREMIFEELEWRYGDEHDRLGRRWRLRWPGGPLWVTSAASRSDATPAAKGAPRLSPVQLAAEYRALRKAREDNKNQAGAGDLYYGEMEMRRLTSLPSGRGWLRAICDRSVITAYWLLSGYGLKASRAFLSWVILVVAGALLLATWGVSPEPSFRRALLFSFECTSSLIRVAHLPEGYKLSHVGEVVQVVLRLSGPLLVGLWLLALRSRVKR